MLCLVGTTCGTLMGLTPQSKPLGDMHERDEGMGDTEVWDMGTQRYGGWGHRGMGDGDTELWGWGYRGMGTWRIRNGDLGHVGMGTWCGEDTLKRLYFCTARILHSCH